ncbi:MAG: tetratricopeptide repeat protein [Pseudomonadota bacterium]
MTSDKLSMSGSGTLAGSQEIEDLMKQLRASKTPEAALKLARRAVELRPKNPDLRLILAVTLHNQGKAQEAEHAYGECLMLDRENVPALTNLGSLQISGGQAEAGLKALEGALHLDPDNQQARFHKGRGLGRLGRADEALKIFDELAVEQPDNVEVIKSQALCHMDIGHKTKAAELLFRAAELAPHDKAVSNALKKVTS